MMTRREAAERAADTAWDRYAQERAVLARVERGSQWTLAHEVAQRIAREWLGIAMACDDAATDPTL